MVEETEEGAAKRSSSLVPASLRPRAPKPRPAPPVRAKERPAPSAPPPAAAKKPLSAGPAPSSLGSFSAVENEYDPARPNDYEEFCRERDAKAIADARQRELAKEMEASQAEARARGGPGPSLHAPHASSAPRSRGVHVQSLPWTRRRRCSGRSRRRLPCRAEAAAGGA